jgi:thiol:disulfide interchange protein DsbD
VRPGCLVLLAGIAFGQTNVLSVVPGEKVRIKRNESVSAKVHLQLRPGYHVNSNTPAESYLIPLKLTWKADPLEAGEVIYPKPSLEKYEFSEKPVSVFSGDFEIVTKFKAPASAPNGPAIVTGKLRYQACNDKMCLPPKTIDVPLTVEIQ